MVQQYSIIASAAASASDKMMARETVTSAAVAAISSPNSTLLQLAHQKRQQDCSFSPSSCMQSTASSSPRSPRSLSSPLISSKSSSSPSSLSLATSPLVRACTSLLSLTTATYISPSLTAAARAAGDSALNCRQEQHDCTVSNRHTFSEEASSNHSCSHSCSPQDNTDSTETSISLHYPRTSAKGLEGEQHQHLQQGKTDRDIRLANRTVSRGSGSWPDHQSSSPSSSSSPYRHHPFESVKSSPATPAHSPRSRRTSQQHQLLLASLHRIGEEESSQSSPSPECHPDEHSLQQSPRKEHHSQSALKGKGSVQSCNTFTSLSPRTNSNNNNSSPSNARSSSSVPPPTSSRRPSLTHHLQAKVSSSPPSCQPEEQALGHSNDDAHCSHTSRVGGSATSPSPSSPPPLHHPLLPSPLSPVAQLPPPPPPPIHSPQQQTSQKEQLFFPPLLISSDRTGNCSTATPLSPFHSPPRLCIDGDSAGGSGSGFPLAFPNAPFAQHERRDSVRSSWTGVSSFSVDSADSYDLYEPSFFVEGIDSPTASTFSATKDSIHRRLGLFQGSSGGSDSNNKGKNRAFDDFTENHELAPIYFIDPTLSTIMDSDVFQSLGSNPDACHKSQPSLSRRNSNHGGNTGPLRSLGFGKKGKSASSSNHHHSNQPIRLSPSDTHPQKPSARNTPMLSFQLHHNEISTDRPSVSGRLLLHIPRLQGKKFHFVSMALHLRLKEAIAWTRQDLVSFEIERQSWSQTVWDKKMMLQFQDKQVEEGPDSYMTCRVKEESLALEGIAGAAVGAIGGSGGGGLTGGQRSRDVSLDIAADEWRWEWLMPVTRHEVRPESFEGSMGTLWYELEAKCLFRWDEVDEDGRVKETLFPSTQAVDAILDSRTGKVDSSYKEKYPSDEKNGKEHGKTKSLAKVFSKLRVRNKPTSNKDSKPMATGNFKIGRSPIANTFNISATEAVVPDQHHNHHHHHKSGPHSINDAVHASGGSTSLNNKVQPDSKPVKTGPPEPLPFLIRKVIKLYFVKPPPRSSSNPAFFLPAPSMALPNLPGTRRLKAIIPGARIQVQIQIPSVIPIPGYELTSNLVPSHKKGGGFLVPASDRNHQHHYHHHAISAPTGATAATAAEEGSKATATSGKGQMSAREKERQALRSQYPADFQVALTIRKVTNQDIQRNHILRRRYENSNVRPPSMTADPVHGHLSSHHTAEAGGTISTQESKKLPSQSKASSIMDTATSGTGTSPSWGQAESTRSMDPLITQDGNLSIMSSISSLPPEATASATPRAWRKEIRVRRVKCEFWQKESCRIPTDNAPSRTVKVALGQPFIYSDKDQGKGKTRQNSVAQQIIPLSQGGVDGGGSRYNLHDSATTPAEEEQLLQQQALSGDLVHSQLPPGFRQQAQQAQQAFMLLIPVPLDSPKLRQTFSWPTQHLLAQVTQAIVATNQLQQPGYAGAGGPVIPRPTAVDGHFFLNDKRNGAGCTSVDGGDTSNGYHGYSQAYGSEFDHTSSHLNTAMYDAGFGVSTNGGVMTAATELGAAAGTAVGGLYGDDGHDAPSSSSIVSKLPHVKARIEVKHYLSFRLSIDMLEFEGEPEDEEQDLELAEEQQLQQVKERQELSAAVLAPGSRSSFYEQIRQRHQAAAAAAAVAAVRAAAAATESDGAASILSPPPSQLTATGGDPLRGSNQSTSLHSNQQQACGGSAGSTINMKSSSVSIANSSHSGISVGWNSQRRGSKESLGTMHSASTNADDHDSPTANSGIAGHAATSLPAKERLLKKASIPLLNRTATANTSRVNVHKLKDFVIRVPVTVVIQPSDVNGGDGGGGLVGIGGGPGSSAESGTAHGPDSLSDHPLYRHLINPLSSIASSSKMQQPESYTYHATTVNDNARATMAVGVVGDQIEVFSVASKDQHQQAFATGGSSSASSSANTQDAMAKRLQQLYQLQQQQSFLSPLDLLTNGMGGMGGVGVMDDLEYEIGEEQDFDDEEKGVMITRGAIGL